LGAFENENAFKTLLDNFLISPDILHNIMGLSDTILQNLIDDHWINVEIFNSKLRVFLRREFLSSCKGLDLRYIVLNWEQFIIPSQVPTLLETQQELLHKFFLIWSEIVWISYQNHKVEQKLCFRML